MSTITTNYGTFNVIDNGKNGTIVSVGSIRIIEFPKVSWWNRDALEKAIEEHIELINKRIEERVGSFTKNNNDDVTITKDNALQALEQLVQVLGNQERGFYSGRLKQCINRMKLISSLVHVYEK